MDLASVVAALASVGVRVSGSTPNNNIQGDSSRACPTGLAGPEPSGTHNDPGQHFQYQCTTQVPRHQAAVPLEGLLQMQLENGEVLLTSLVELQLQHCEVPSAQLLHV